MADYVRERLTWAREESPDEIPYLVADGLRDFQAEGKRKFTSAETPCVVKVGRRQMMSKQLPIKRGSYAIKGCDVNPVPEILCC